MRKSIVAIMMLAVMLVLSFAVCAQKASLSGEIDLDLSELFVVERGYAVPIEEDEMPVVFQMHEDSGMEMWHVNLYLLDKDEFVQAPVLADENAPELVVDEKLSDIYDKQYCKYTLYTSGIYVIEPVTTNTDASVLDGNDENALYSATADKNVTFRGGSNPGEYWLKNADIDKEVAFDENAAVFYLSYDSTKESYELVNYSNVVHSFADDTFYMLNYVVKNNPEENGAETLIYAFAYEVKSTTKTVVISLCTVGVDENGKYKNYYEAFDPYLGTKYSDLAGSSVADTAAELPSALESGLVVTVKNGVVDETATPIGKIDTTDSSKGLVWISGYDAENNTISVVPTYVTENACCKDGYAAALASYSFDGANPDVNFDGREYLADSTGKVSYKLTDNTVVSVLKNSMAGVNATKWGSISLGQLSDVVSSNKNYKCYNDKVLDSNGNYTTKYAPNIAAYVYGTDTSDGLVEADLILVVVNQLASNQQGALNKADDCITHKDACTIECIRVYIAPNDNLDDVPADTVNIEMTVKNNHHTGSALYMLCTYDEYGVLVKTYIKTSTASAGEEDTLVVENIANADSKVKSVKAFVFDTAKVLSPLAKAIEK